MELSALRDVLANVSYSHIYGRSFDASFLPLQDTGLYKSVVFKVKQQAQCALEGGHSCRKESPHAQTGIPAIPGDS